MLDTDPEVISARLEELRKNLVDTNLRNRLINFRAKTQRGGKPLEKVVEVIGEDPQQVLEALVTDGKTMYFKGKPDRRAQTNSDDAEGTEFLFLYQDDDSNASDDLDVDRADNKLNTNETVSALHRKLTKIRRDAESILLEQGVNVLFLALGMLEWYEDDSSQEPRRAPLVLLPVLLERTGNGANKIRWDGSEVGENLSIGAKLKAEFGIKMPNLDEQAGISQYFTAVERACSAKDRWKVDSDAIALGFFSYAKYLMYRDLDQALWPEARKPSIHETLNALLGDGFGEIEEGISEDQFLDPLRVPGDTCEVFDADASQTLAILQANSGQTMLIEGPPGTGKSQTIANIVAEAIGNGRKILFVAEKAEALDVVFRQLKSAGLEDACLQLHSNKTNKRSFYAELKRTVRASAPMVARAEGELRRLLETQATLNAYTDALNSTIEKRAITPRMALGKILGLGAEGEETVRHSFGPMQAWTQDDFEVRAEMLAKLQAHLTRMGTPTRHPFYGSTLTVLLPDDREDIGRAIDSAVQQVIDLETSLKKLAGTLSVTAPTHAAELDDLAGWARLLSESPDLAELAVADPTWPANKPTLHVLLGTCRETRAILEAIEPLVHSSAVEEDPKAAINALRMADLTDALSSVPIAKLQPILDSFEGAHRAAVNLDRQSRQLCNDLGLPCVSTVWSIDKTASLAIRLAAAPDLEDVNVEDDGWLDLSTELHAALEDIASVQSAKRAHGGNLKQEAWASDAQQLTISLEADGPKLLSRLFGSRFKAAYQASGQLFINPPKDYTDRLKSLRAISSVTDRENSLRTAESICKNLLGTNWKGSDSDLERIKQIYAFVSSLHRDVRANKIPAKVLSFFRGGSTSKLLELGQSVRDAVTLYRQHHTEFLQLLRTAGAHEIDKASGDPVERLYRWHVDTMEPQLARIQGMCLKQLELSDQLDVLEQVHRLRTLSVVISEHNALATRLFGAKWARHLSDHEHLALATDWLAKLHSEVAEFNLPAGLISFLANQGTKEELDSLVSECRSRRLTAEGAVERVLTLSQIADPNGAFSESQLSDILQRLRQWRSSLDTLQSLITYNSLVDEAKALGLEEAITLAEELDASAQQLVPLFARAWYTGVLREAMVARPVLARFNRQAHEQTVQEFRALDSLILEINRLKVALFHYRSVPRHRAGGALGWLQSQMELKQGHKPIRQAMTQAFEAIQAIKPVFLMSPLSIAMYLPPEGPQFNVVVFDEASQVKPEDSMGGILRSDQCIVVGDSKQMPPTSFFEKLTSEETSDDEDEADEAAQTNRDMESVLALMSARIPMRSPRRRDLRWHYRSLHDDLIAVSNRLFYDDRLVVFPSPRRHGAETGLVLRHDPTTVYGRGEKRTNPAEARQVVEAALKHVKTSPDLTLGIVAFSKAQQEAILDELDILKRSHREFADFDARHGFEPLFVKNLETVQGDQRDVVLISVGYGRDKDGYVSMSFGPLNRDGGERRLNVLITRARVRCEVFTNLQASDLRLGESIGRGIPSFKHFLTFAESGSLDVPSASGLDPMSPFEEEVLKQLRLLGYDVVPQVGSCGFYIDMAVRDRNDAGKFIIGIECDGAMYHRARTARDRDRLRQAVLESRGWKLHRIWSTDWFHNQDSELRRLVQAIEAAMAPDSANLRITPHQPPAESTEIVLELREFEHNPANPLNGYAPKYELTTAIPPAFYGDLHEMSLGMMAQWLGAIVADESPIHVEELLRRMREQVEVYRAGARIRARYEQALKHAAARDLIKLRKYFAFRPGQTEFIVRTRALMPQGYKKLEYVADEEIGEAILAQVRLAFRAPIEQITILAARMLGFDRVSAEMDKQLRSCIHTLVNNRRLSQAGEILFLPEPTPSIRIE